MYVGSWWFLGMHVFWWLGRTPSTLRVNRSIVGGGRL
jgi:hypothetical protein